MPVLCILSLESEQRMFKTPLFLCLANLIVLLYVLAVNVADFNTYTYGLHIVGHKKLRNERW